jgi:hypothetical protein
MSKTTNKLRPRSASERRGWRDPKTVMWYDARLAAKSGANARLAKRLQTNLSQKNLHHAVLGIMSRVRIEGVEPRRAVARTLISMGMSRSRANAATRNPRS